MHAQGEHNDFTTYGEDEYLHIAEIQHYQFCPRQWGLIYLEHQWAENVLTVEGTLLHQKAHDPEIKEKRGNRIVKRSLRVASPRLGVVGMCDVEPRRQASASLHTRGDIGCSR